MSKRYQKINFYNIFIKYRCPKTGETIDKQLSEYDFDFGTDQHEFYTSGYLDLYIECESCKGKHVITLRSY
jgi:hypothetical protein